MHVPAGGNDARAAFCSTPLQKPRRVSLSAAGSRCGANQRLGESLFRYPARFGTYNQTVWAVGLRRRPLYFLVSDFLDSIDRPVSRCDFNRVHRTNRTD
ncbi:uncharacterized protein MICPUCDRAFT_51634 [Micromonas pusilla CCMP1545]|uniref:Predicted protein n=1 Tax=Micromonas pusilla (strain CCMP1545) TaxID=564608 RepID=C1N2R9_MICPC|nr:uncharacterized protein MICPUCDRAFT_51634 [Micromonas pusilla CCMP1545]EEH53636.1 predicted protein [Micromonas pusilla CCMP1545]|eukprot:XP_003061924.1 predicted protein [Micromonas pusilla CCMP1545]